MAGGFRTWEIESLKVQSPLSRAAFFVPISVWKCAKLELSRCLVPALVIRPIAETGSRSRHRPE
jgi:hypothetical protein